MVRCSQVQTHRPDHAGLGQWGPVSLFARPGPRKPDRITTKFIGTLQSVRRLAGMIVVDASWVVATARSARRTPRPGGVV